MDKQRIHLWQIPLEVPWCSPLLDARALRQAKDFSKSFIIYPNCSKGFG